MSSFLYRDRAKQLIDFESLTFLKIHPTDIDAIMEFGGRKLILFEYKYNNKPIDIGQKLLLKRIADAWSSCEDKEAIAVIADHYQEDTSKDVDAGNAIVRELYYKNKWYPYIGLNRTVRDVVISFAGDELERKTGIKWNTKS